MLNSPVDNLKTFLTENLQPTRGVKKTLQDVRETNDCIGMALLCRYVGHSVYSVSTLLLDSLQFYQSPQLVVYFYLISRLKQSFSLWALKRLGVGVRWVPDTGGAASSTNTPDDRDNVQFSSNVSVKVVN